MLRSYLFEAAGVLLWRDNLGENGDEKRQPYQIMIAPSPHRRQPLIIVPLCDCRGAAISSHRIGCRPTSFIGLRGWVLDQLIRSHVSLRPELCPSGMSGRAT